MTSPPATHTVSVETIAHYRCGTCNRWWSVANYGVARRMTCPHCGTDADVRVNGGEVEP